MPTLSTDSRSKYGSWSSQDYFVQRGHLHTYSDRTQVFLNQLHFEIDQLGTNSTLLDIGCGHGIALEQTPQFRIAERVGTYLGVEPDKSVTPPSCFHRVWSSSLEDADIPPQSVDIAYSQITVGATHLLEREGRGGMLAKVVGLFVVQ